LIDGGATHNFIDSALVAKRGIPTMDFEGFDVAVAQGACYALHIEDLTTMLDIGKLHSDG
jgi:hypothetical protein